MVAPTGLIITKLDGTARGGAVVALRRELNVPIRFVGTGETLDDLAPFDAKGGRRRSLSEPQRPRWRTPPAVLAMLVVGTAAVVVAYGTAWLPGGAPPWGSWAMVVGVALLLPGTLLLGALRRGRTPPDWC